MKREWLTDIRKNKGITQIELASKAFIHPSYVCLIENGEKTPSVDTAKSIASILGFDWTRFYE